MTKRQIDIAAHLCNQNYSMGVQGRRVAWGMGALVFRLTPRLGGYALRNALLRLFGARIGPNVHIHPTARIMFPWNLSIESDVVIGPNVTLYNLGCISIGQNVMISQGAHLCAGDHDWRLPNLPLQTPDIVVEPECWICAEAFIGPGAHIRRGAVCGARAVVFGSTPEGAVLAGNPARPLALRREAGGDGASCT